MKKGDGDETETGEDTKKKAAATAAISRSPNTRATLPTPQHAALFKFLESLFCGDGEFPQRILLAAAYGPTGMRLGPTVKEATFHPGMKKLTREECVQFSNELLHLAEEDCDALGRPTKYVCCAFDYQRGDRPYGRVLLSLRPSGMFNALAEARGYADDDEDEGRGAIKDDLLGELYRDRRFGQEHLARMFEAYQGAMEGLVSKYENRLAATEHVNQELLKTHMELIKTKEEMLDRKSARELKVAKEKFWQGRIEHGFSMLEGALPHVLPMLAGKANAVAEALRAFVQSLDPAQQTALLGDWSDAGTLITPGVIDEAQGNLLAAIGRGTEPPARMADFIASLRPEQMAQAQTILRPDQIAKLMSLAAMAKNGANGAANGAAS